MKNLLVLIFSFLTIGMYAQQQECGTYTSPEDMEVFYNRERAPENSFKAGSVVEIPIVYHLTHRDDGTGGFDLAETFRLHCDLNERYENSEIHFYILDIIDHNNTGYFDMTLNNAGSVMMNNENNRDACNVFIVDDALSGGTSVCGYSFLASGWGGPNRGGVILDIGCSGAGSTTLTHEMGHYLNLPHTFYWWENTVYGSDDEIPEQYWERADGSNCSTTADGFCDTPPDYISTVRWECNSPQVLTDAVGQEFTVDEKNYMSYSVDGCQSYFKQEQIDEMKNTPSTHRSYLSNLTAPNTDALDAPTLIYPPNNIVGLALGDVEFKWNEIPGATYYLFEMSLNNFTTVVYSEVLTTNSVIYSNLGSNSYYSWRVKAMNYGSVCNESSLRSFSTSTFSASVTYDNVFCNGKSDGNAAAITDEAEISSYFWYRFDSNTNAYVNFNISTSSNLIYNLGANSYYVELVRPNGTKSVVPFDIVEPTFLDVELSQNSNSVLTTVTGGTPPYSFLWSDGSSLSENNNPVNGGTSTLYLTDDNGCFISKSYNFTSTISSINDELTEITNLTVYPNPVKGDNVFINFDSKKDINMTLELFSVDGKQVRDYNRTIAVGENTLALPISSLDKGVYYIKFSINKKTITRKIIL